jgi:hypothetical protein
MGAAPIYRGQGNQPFQAFQRDSVQKRGQTIPYDVNGAPPAAVVPDGDYGEVEIIGGQWFIDKPGALSININDLTLADPAEPLFEFEVPAGGIVFTGVGDQLSAGVAASAPSALRLFKDGVANGDITFTGAAGVPTFTDSSYNAGELFSLYPPLALDATLDRVRITLGTN